MFEVPAAKRVKRTKLSDNGPINDSLEQAPGEEHDQSSKEENGPVDYGFEYDFIEPHPATTSKIYQAADAQPAEEALQFNLFRPTSRPSAAKNSESTTATRPDSQAQPALISLRSPSPPTATDPANLKFRTERPDSYYFTASISPTRLKNLRDGYAQCAITTATIQHQSSRPWPGTHLSWRVITLPAHRKQIVVHKAEPASTITKPVSTPIPPNSAGRGARARPSKKRRDLLKLKAQRRQRVIDESKTKEEHEKEKRNKKNRERKLKRRAKERREKEGARGVKLGSEVGDGTGGDADGVGDEIDDD
ncbi:hypothetical protein PMZ80_000033 [Knufia obscura]|uniref:Uncharacterized protein n=2 Tax=Knufia TaxID=430999 RepID=A0AAN8I3V7_9EURO|nr:hypothetical protein PMZ80_000033 [Knufia obscura]KAK5948786.1 hypothetical protein OHC33_010209 [Knufia fluminis]